MILFAFLAGALTILNPCVLPLLPVAVAGARAKSIAAPLALALGLALTFAVTGTVLASLSVELGDTGAVRTGAAVMMVAFGAAVLIPAVGQRLEAVLLPLTALGGRVGRESPAGLLGFVGMGALLAVVWAPCVGPTLGAAIALAASSGSLGASFATMAAFGFGAAGSLLIAGYGLGQLAGAGRAAVARSARQGRLLLGLAFLAVGLLILTGYDKVIEAFLVEAMPDWLVRFATVL